MNPEPCQHFNTWRISEDRYEWCYQCGAIRRTQPAGGWVRPTGRGGKNPVGTVKGRDEWWPLETDQR